jgi:hypothetical protein
MKVAAAFCGLILCTSVALAKPPKNVQYQDAVLVSFKDVTTGQHCSSNGSAQTQAFSGIVKPAAESWSMEQAYWGQAGDEERRCRRGSSCADRPGWRWIWRLGVSLEVAMRWATDGGVEGWLAVGGGVGVLLRPGGVDSGGVGGHEDGVVGQGRGGGIDAARVKVGLLPLTG